MVGTAVFDKVAHILDGISTSINVFYFHGIMGWTLATPVHSLVPFAGCPVALATNHPIQNTPSIVCMLQNGFCCAKRLTTTRNWGNFY